jgi:hypothetical protein
MSNELDIYKKIRIDRLKLTFKNNLVRLNSNLGKNIRNIKNSKIRNKSHYIKLLISKYNIQVVNLRNKLNIDINTINSFTPKFNVIGPNNKKALLIGINYINTPYALSGCIDDTTRIQELLIQHGFNDLKILTDLTSIKPTKQNILNEFKNLIVNAVAGDILVFYFSGHGSYTYDINGDETDRKDEMIISFDLQTVIDDELKNILSTYMKNDVTIFGLFDSCHSGTMFDLKFNYLDSNNFDNYFENNKVTECNGNVIMISGCMDNQTSVETVIDSKPQGAMSWSFIQCINKTPNCSWRELLKSMRDLLKTSSYSQIPQLSTDSFYDIDSKIFI